MKLLDGITLISRVDVSHVVQHAHIAQCNETQTLAMKFAATICSHTPRLPHNLALQRLVSEGQRVFVKTEEKKGAARVFVSFVGGEV